MTAAAVFMCLQDARSTAECGLAVLQQQLQESNNNIHQLQEEAATAQVCV
jgi:hypothetical protein